MLWYPIDFLQISLQRMLKCGKSGRTNSSTRVNMFRLVVVLVPHILKLIKLVILKVNTKGQTAKYSIIEKISILFFENNM